MAKIRKLAPSTVKQYSKQDKLGGVVWIGTEGIELQKIIDRINEDYEEHGIFYNDVRYTLDNCIIFDNETYNESCLVFPFLDEMPLDIHKLAMWRMTLRQMGVGVMWVEDYIYNRMR
jgi:hypothetical protein